MKLLNFQGVYLLSHLCALAVATSCSQAQYTPIDYSKEPIAESSPATSDSKRDLSLKTPGPTDSENKTETSDKSEEKQQGKQSAGSRPEILVTEAPTPKPSPTLGVPKLFTIQYERVSSDSNKNICLHIAIVAAVPAKETPIFVPAGCNEGSEAKKEILITYPQSNVTPTAVLKFVIKGKNTDPVEFVPANRDFLKIGKKTADGMTQIQFSLEDDQSDNSKKDLNDFIFKLSYASQTPDVKWPGDL